MKVTLTPFILIALLGLSSCLEKVDATRVTDKDFQGVQNLENNALQQLQNEVLTNKPVLKIPNDGDSIKQEFILTEAETMEFQSPKDPDILCRYSYDSYDLTSTIKVEEFDGIVTRSLVTLKTPKAPKFTNIPFDVKKEAICNEDIALLSKEETNGLPNLAVNHAQTISFVQGELFDSLSKCQSKLKVGDPAMSCLKAEVLRGERNDSPFKTYSIEVEFSLLDGNKNLVKKLMKFEVSPEISYMLPFGLVNSWGSYFSGKLKNAKSIKTIKLLDESIQ